MGNLSAYDWLAIALMNFMSFCWGTFFYAYLTEYRTEKLRVQLREAKTDIAMLRIALRIAPARNPTEG